MKHRHDGPTSAHRVTVIIVNWNAGEHLARCVQCLLQQSLLPARIVIIDNNSGDDSLRQLPASPLLQVHINPDNLGFAAANNQALQNCDTDLVALLNPDAFAEPDWLQQLVDAADTHPHAAAFGSRQLQPDGQLADGTGDVYHFSGLVWRRDHGQPLSSAQGPRDIFSPCAAAALYRLEAVRAAGGFDEDFFCYIEDVDLGFRLRLAGHQALLVPQATVTHIGSASTGGAGSDFAVYHGHRNLVWAFIKNMPGPLLWALLPAHLALTLVSLVVFSARGQGRVMLKAKADAFRALPTMWRKRHHIQRHRQATTADIWQALDKRLCRLGK